MQPLKKKILVIEDDQATAEVLCHLADMLDLECVIETEVVPLVEIKRHRPDLILLDYRLSNGLAPSVFTPNKKYALNKRYLHYINVRCKPN